MEQLYKSLNIIMSFLLSEGFAGGLIGAVLLIAASYFVDVGLTVKGKLLRNASWGLKIVYVFSGSILGSLLHYAKDVDILVCAAMGASWPYVIKQFRKMVETYVTGKRLMEQKRVTGSS